MSKITLYTSRYCPWAHRVHIALAELGLEFEEVAIDLAVPREKWYLEKVNPRGLVPALKYDNEVLTESGIITQFLCDAYPSHLLPAPTTPKAALERARIAFFVDTFTSKIASQVTGIALAATPEDQEQRCEGVIKVVENEISPLLEDAAPFFANSREMTLAEVNTASFVLRIYTFGKPVYGLYPKFLLPRLNEIKPWQKWVDTLLGSTRVTEIFQEEEFMSRIKPAFEKARASGSMH